MLTELKAYSSWRSAPTLPLAGEGRSETDIIQIINIDGLDPVKASVSTSERAVDGDTYTGSKVPSRNIVITLRPNPDWSVWTYAEIRRLLYSYFMPKRLTRLVFYSDDMDPVEISGIVEDVTINLFSKEPDIVVSIICPYPYFVALNPTIVNGQAVRSGGAPTVVTYNGNIETGIKVKLTTLGAPYPSSIAVQVGDPSVEYFSVDATMDEMKYFEMNSVTLNKYIQNVDLNSGVITNLLSKKTEGSTWPLLQPGDNDFSIITDQGDQDWELSYFERFGGL